KDNALNILDRYRARVPSFNDDIQGTGAVALAGVYSACRVRGDTLADQRIVIHGAGAAGLGICRQIKAGLRLAGLSEADICSRVAVLDSRGMLVDDREIADAYKQEMAWTAEQAEAAGLPDASDRGLHAVVAAFRPTVLIGASGQAGAFDEALVREMAKHTDRPVILPFSNPTAIAEAQPADVLNWTDGRALIATGSPFDPVEYAGRTIEIGQGNNVFIFPGIGLGALLAEVDQISDEVISASAQALAATVSDAELERGLLFPSIDRLREVAAAVAEAVMREAASEGIGNGNLDNLVERIEAAMWVPRYTEYVAAD
ncbi:MAG: oxaloacetate-decarboxylating malate dehydrogenase, partial [Gammaproteobacteria bacterium]|nr:oxaloacetate-decarboxylating malate dehydrogenase [Gammaproteobacteria bacterium]